MEWSVKGESKINFWVVDIGGSGSRNSSTTHSVRIPLKPVTSDEQPILTGGNITPE